MHPIKSVPKWNLAPTIGVQACATVSSNGGVAVPYWAWERAMTSHNSPQREWQYWVLYMGSQSTDWLWYILFTAKAAFPSLRNSTWTSVLSAEKGVHPVTIQSPILASPRLKGPQAVQMPVQQSSQMHCQALTPSSTAIDPQLKGSGLWMLGWHLLWLEVFLRRLHPWWADLLARVWTHCPPSPMKLISFGHIPIFGLNDMPNPFEGSSIMLPVQWQKPTLSPEDTASLEDGNWPAWFEKVRETLKSPLLSLLGDEWDGHNVVLDVCWSHQGFVTSRTSIGPQSASELCLAEVGSWQKWKQGMDYVPELGQKDLKSLGGLMVGMVEGTSTRVERHLGGGRMFGTWSLGW